MLYEHKGNDKNDNKVRYTALRRLYLKDDGIK